MEFLTAGANAPFSAALLLMLLIGAAEAVGLGGAGFDADADAEVGGLPLLGWLNIGRLPLLMLLVVFLMSFGVLGLVAQRVFLAVTGTLAAPFLAAPVILAACLPITRLLTRSLARVLPGDETTAVSRDELVGRMAVVVTGVARSGSAAQARLRDVHGQRHYVMIEPDTGEDSLVEGDKVLLVRRSGATFYAVKNSSPALEDARV